MTATLTIDDFIMLGRTFPQETKNKGVTVCAVGYSQELNQLIRIYPLQITDKIPKWSKVQLKLIKPRTDNRRESWKLNEPFKPSDIIGSISKEEGFNTLLKLVKPSINCLNADKASIGILKPTAIKFKLEKQTNSMEDLDYYQQLNLFGCNQDRPKLYLPNYIPRLELFNADNSFNKLQLREGGCSEFMGKGRDPNDLIENLKLNDSNYQQLLIVGNTKTHRNTWLVISTVFSKDTSSQQLLWEDIA